MNAISRQLRMLVREEVSALLEDTGVDGGLFGGLGDLGGLADIAADVALSNVHPEVVESALSRMPTDKLISIVSPLAPGLSMLLQGLKDEGVDVNKFIARFLVKLVYRKILRPSDVMKIVGSKVGVTEPLPNKQDKAAQIADAFIETLQELRPQEERKGLIDKTLGWFSDKGTAGKDLVLRKALETMLEPTLEERTMKITTGWWSRRWGNRKR